MKKLLILFLSLGITGVGQAADAAKDLILIQRNDANTGNTQRNVGASNLAVIGFDGSGHPTTYASSVFGQSLLSAADASAGRTALGLGVLATTTPGTGVATFLSTPTFANFAAAVTGATPFASTTTTDVLQAGQFAADAGSTDAYAVTFSPAIASYVTGAHYRFKANTANTGAATININSLGAKTIVKVAGGVTTTLADNDIRSGQWVDLVYDGTNMQMQSTLGNAAGGGGSGTVNSGTANQLAYYASTGTAVSGLTSANSGFLVTSSSGVPSISSTVPNHTINPASGQATLTVKAPASQHSVVLFQANNDGPAITELGVCGATNGIVTGSAAGDMFFAVNGNSQRVIFSTVAGLGAIGLTLESANAGISWAGSTSSEVPIKSNLKVFPASGQATVKILAAAGQDARILFQANNDGPAVTDLGVAGAANDLITGSAVGDMCFRVNGNGQAFAFSVDTSTIALKVYGTSGQVSAEKTTDATGTTDGALRSKGGLSVAKKGFFGDNVDTAGDYSTSVVGKTLKIKSGSNAKAGTFTLSSGAATVSNTSITANSVVKMSLKTASGSITAAPYLTAVTAATSFVVAAGAGDNSTYNYVILEVN